ncbi:MAG: GDP-mannose 4,6-dehydratase [Chloroflexi bacterium]|nr:GDP-mannose 4,6-dehydratase [Chloroflexota bacterium]
MGGRRLSALVTGGAGFIGRHVVAELLQRGEPVRVLDNLSRSRSTSLDAFEGDPAYLGLVHADVTDADAVNRAAADVDAFYHLAADVAVGASVRDPTGAMRANVLGTLVVAEAARRRDLRLVLVSTCHVYAAANEPLAEDAATIPASPYAASKLAAEVIAQSYAQTYGLRLTTVRPFNVYGPWQRDDAEGGVVARFLSGDLAGATLEVHGNGAQTRDFVYVDDCARGIVDAAGESAVGRTLNLASGAETSITQLARLIAGDPSRVRHVRHPHPEAEVARYIGDAALARQTLGWTPRVDLAEGLARTRAWFADRA